METCFSCVHMPRGSSPFHLSFSFLVVISLFSPLHLELLLSFLRYDMLRIHAAFSAVYFYHIDLFWAAKIIQTYHCACNIQEIAN